MLKSRWFVRFWVFLKHFLLTAFVRLDRLPKLVSDTLETLVYDYVASVGV